VLATARKYLIQRADRWLEAADRTSEPFRLVLRSSTAGKVLVALRETTTPFPDAARLAERLTAAHPELAGVVRIRALAGQRGGARVLPVTGRSWLEERIGEVTFRLPAASFLQVNPQAAQLLLQLVREGVGPPAATSVIELYGGAGAFGVNLARAGASVTLCEADLAAVRAGREAARGSTSNIKFVHADVGAFLRRCKTEGRRADVVVADPPRAGLGRRVPEQIAALSPRRVVLVSCDPATLARDTRRLTAAGFVAERAVPVDVFPQTAHVETVLTLTRP
jgi:23S rRNA (uracil1939-C5)-methyltransferase